VRLASTGVASAGASFAVPQFHSPKFFEQTRGVYETDGGNVCRVGPFLFRDGVRPGSSAAITGYIPGVVAGGTKVQVIKEGFQGTEGPISLPDGSLIFTETQANCITKIDKDGNTSTFLENTNGPNGLVKGLFASSSGLLDVCSLSLVQGLVSAMPQEMPL
jgi:hypothetical protein